MMQKKKNILVLILIVALILSISALIFSIRAFSLLTENVNNKKNIAESNKSIVAILSGIDVEKEILTSDVIVGTGFCYDKGKIITNYHNIQDNLDTINIITYDDQVLRATVIAQDPQIDIALLEVNADIPALAFANSDECEKGQFVMSIATPISVHLRGTYTEGFITNLNITGFGAQRLTQTNIDLSPGCSGGPLLNESGEVIGMTTFKSTEFGAEGLGFAIPSNQLKNSIDRLEQGVKTPDLKITFENDIYQKYGLPGAKGLMVQEIGEKSMAKDYLQKGDLIIKVNNRDVCNIVEYYESLQQTVENKKIGITVIRDNKEYKFEIGE